jgi:predicted dehydrogenase
MRMSVAAANLSHRPRLGFAGVGWIGLNRLQSVVATDAADIVCITDVNADCAARALAALQRQRLQPPVRLARSFDELLDEDLDGVVIATPSGLHATQTTAALQLGRAVFCQKPLARTAAETARTIAAARAHDRLLAVDFCYRTVAGVPQLLQLARSGAIGQIFAADLVFHNAYGPDKPWFYDLGQSGGGCVMDLGIHLIDLLLLVMGYAPLAGVRSRLYAGGQLLPKPAVTLEDHALAEVEFVTGATARIACSWRLSAGQDAVIAASFYGTHGALILHNVRGSFYEFTVDHCEGTRRYTLAAGPDDWGGRAVNSWASQLRVAPGFDANVLRLQEVAAVIDAIYGRE